MALVWRRRFKFPELATLRDVEIIGTDTTAPGVRRSMSDVNTICTDSTPFWMWGML